MNRYTIVRTEGEKEPSGIPELTLDHVLWEPDCGIRAGGRIRHDGRNLYVHLTARETEIRAEYTSPLDPVHEDSCLEFFFMPEAEERYLNFEINPNGCLHIGLGRERAGRERLFPPDPEKLFDIRTARTLEGWEVSYRIPADFLRKCWPGFDCTGTLRANVYKCGDRTARPHYLSWNPVNTPAPDFHRPEFFGEMSFG